MSIFRIYKWLGCPPWALELLKLSHPCCPRTWNFNVLGQHGWANFTISKAHGGHRSHLQTIGSILKLKCWHEWANCTHVINCCRKYKAYLKKTEITDIRFTSRWRRVFNEPVRNSGGLHKKRKVLIVPELCEIIFWNNKQPLSLAFWQ